ncbi:hypothetical protein ACFL1B_00380 [Nanoarchaeota archaeon]
MKKLTIPALAFLAAMTLGQEAQAQEVNDTTKATPELELAEEPQEANDTTEATPVVELAAGVKAVNQYVLTRGFNPDKEPALQPWFTVDFHGGDLGDFQVEYWGHKSFVQETDNRSGYNVEDDLILRYTQTFGTPLGDLSASAQWAMFMVHNGFTGEEWRLQVGLKNELNPQVFFAHDYRDARKAGGNGNYLEASLNPSVTVDVPVLGEATFGVSGAVLSLDGYVIPDHETVFRFGGSASKTFAGYGTITFDVRHIQADDEVNFPEATQYGIGVSFSAPVIKK